MIPPALAWLTSFCESTGLALDQPITVKIDLTTNPLVHKVTLSWRESISATAAMLVWNLFQKWAGKNESTPSGQIEFNEKLSPVAKAPMIFGFSVEVHVKERLGRTKNQHPAF